MGGFDVSAAVPLSKLHRVTDSEVGNRIRDRRVRLGMSLKALAELAGVDRGRLSALEKGEANARQTTIALVERALDRFEHETGMDELAGEDVTPSENSLIEFTVEGDFGVRVVVKGPIRDAEALERSVARIIQNIRTREGEN